MSDSFAPKLKTWDVFRANTHTEFLNAAFRTKYSKGYIYRKCWWVYSNDIIVWFGRINGKVKNEFVNTWIDKDTIEQNYAGKTGLYNGAPLNLCNEYPYRLIFEIIDKPSRKYIFQGLYKLDKDNSTSYKLVLRKVSDVFPIN